ncbi:MAG TPA: hypothetical protein VF808_20300 [Ktedonobacterales bacterium]
MINQTTWETRLGLVARWVARIAGGLFALGLIAMAALGSWDFAHMDAIGVAQSALLIVAIAALILAWFQELAGGALLLLVGAAVLGIELTKGVVDGGPFAFLILGALFLYSWWALRPHARPA